MTARNGKPRESALFREPRFRVVIEVGTCATEEQAERIIDAATETRSLQVDGQLFTVPLTREMFSVQRA